MILEARPCVTLNLGDPKVTLRGPSGDQGMSLLGWVRKLEHFFQRLLPADFVEKVGVAWGAKS